MKYVTTFAQYSTYSGKLTVGDPAVPTDESFDWTLAGSAADGMCLFWFWAGTPKKTSKPRSKTKKALLG